MIGTGSVSDKQRKHALKTERRRQGRPFFILDREEYALNSVCGVCGKAIWDGSRCYLCATGRARTVLRPHEDIEPVNEPRNMRCCERCGLRISRKSTRLCRHCNGLASVLITKEAA